MIPTVTFRPRALLLLLVTALALLTGFALAQSFNAQAAMQQASQAAPRQQTLSSPARHRYQGLLYLDDGTPLNGTYDVTISIYDIVFGGEPLWYDTYFDVAFREGVFEVILGSQLPLGTTLVNSPRYVGVSVDGGPEFIPRERMHPVPWAIYSDIAEHAPDAPSAVSAVTALQSTYATKTWYSDYLDPLTSSTYVVQNSGSATPASLDLTLWQSYPNGTMCGLSDLYTSLTAGMLHLDCRIDATTKKLHAGAYSWCAATCLKVGAN